MTNRKNAIVMGLAASIAAFGVSAKELTPEQQAAKSEVWEPVPAMVETAPGKAPSDAVVLFDGTVCL